MNISIDLKWSLWSTQRTYFDEYAPGVWDTMRAAFDGTGTEVLVNTAPRKEIRYGSVLVQPGQMHVHFWAEWDNGQTFHVDDTVGGGTFEMAMHAADHREVDLIGVSEEQPGEECLDCGYKADVSKVLATDPDPEYDEDNLDPEYLVDISNQT